MLALGNLRRCQLDGFADVLRQVAQLDIHCRGRALDQPQRADETARHALPGHREIVHRPLRLRPPQRVAGHLQLAHAVVFDPETLAHCITPRFFRFGKGTCGWQRA
ncbi:hypothetical protein D3C72_1913790 [compost metagenome]